MTPALKQFQQFKMSHPGFILFFHSGDFYECFHDDATTTARVLGLVLLKTKDGSVPMTAVAAHALESSLRKMIAAGHRVAICEPAEQPAGKA